MTIHGRLAFVVTFALLLTTSAISTPAAAAASVAAPAATTSTPAAAPAPLAGAVPEVRPAVHYDVSPPLMDLATANVEQRGDHRDIPRRELPNNRNAAATGSASPSGTTPSLTAPTLGANFDGVGQGLGSYVVCCAPPDTNGAAGPNDYVQTVNLDFAVFNKTTGAVRYGPVPMNTLFAGFGGGCQFDNDGDPTVIYDAAAGRWLISQFAVTTTHYLNCVAISRTSDPTGSYNRYSFSYADFPDYPKFGVWNDGYYVSLNLFAGGIFFAGAGACAYDRARMLQGLSATQICFRTSTAYGGLLPSTIDGATPPPAGAPNYFVGINTSTTLVSWKLHADWVTPANSTFTGPVSLTVPAYTSSCATFARGDCVPQGGTSRKLESLADRAMYRLAYRNFGDHEALVFNHTIEVGSGATLHSGVRWYELRPSSGNLTVFQQGTYSPDNNWRWMGSIAMDKSGNMALGYSVSGTSLSPGIRFTGRLAGDAAGTMSQGENIIVNGGGSQTGTLARWGDYSSMAIDPVDDCTFWYTNEYLKTSGSFNWSTRIASFKLPGCGSPDFSIAVSPGSQTVAQGSSTTYTATVTPSGGFTGTVSLSASGLPAGAVASFNPASVTTSGSSTMTVTTASTTPTGTSVLTVTGTSGTLTHSATTNLVVTAPPTPDFSLSATPASQSVVQGASTSYAATVTPTNGFTGTVTFGATGLPAGATATFNPTSVTTSGSSTMNVTTSTTTPTGSYPITITGTSGSLTHSATVTLVVNAPADFSLAATPASQSVVQGSSTSYTVNITRTGGFTSEVTFSLSPLPTGAAGTFNPTTASGASSALNVTTASSTPTGTYPLTITGTSGTLTHTASATLVVTTAPAANFTISATPASRSIMQGQTTSYTIAITRTGGFIGAVGLTVSGLGAGATASFNPTSTTGNTSTLTITTTAAAATGTFALTITGTSGSITRTAGVTLVVAAGCTNGNCQN
ncbi:MAG: hypothetical protein M3R21_09295 [Candidatus Dormibacteraeota bacterium]|nr:hypothetical protein [Candidatus Dormibacteraeota bacterium]